MDFAVRKFYLVLDGPVKFCFFFLGGGGVFEESQNIEVLEEMKVMIVSINLI